MSTGRWDKVGRLLEEARERPPGERSAFLEEACEDDALREDVRSLLEAEEEGASGFFEGLAAALPSGLEGEDAEAGSLRVEDPLDLVGESVGRYEVEAHLGGGGMGVVYRARDPELERPVALKFLSPHLSGNETAKQRFAREARAVSALDHPNIATIYEIGEAERTPGIPGGYVFSAMAYYEGESLKEKLARQGPLPVEEALGYAEQIAEGLAKAHEEGIVHRDVKPANVMVTEGGVAKIVDFGLAKMAGAELTRTGATPGTAAYMSPEQAKGDEVDGRADLWALGVVLYEMLTGERPFKGEHSMAILRKVLDEEPPALGERRREVPSVVEEAVHRCLRKDPSGRYASAEALLEALRSESAEEDGTTEEAPLRPSGTPESLEEAGGRWAGARRFIRGLYRRRVLHVGVVYGGLGLIILEGADLLAQIFHLPSWTIRWIMVLLALGFPLAIGLVWVFDVTEEGLVRTREVEDRAGEETTGEESAGIVVARAFLLSATVMIGILVVGLGGALWFYGGLAGAEQAGVDPGGTVSYKEGLPRIERTGEGALDLDPARIAVLYFDDHSPGQTLTAFADGFTEHLIHRLAQVEGLDVIPRHAVKPYRDEAVPLDSLARNLRAGSLVEGSVRRGGDELVVTVQLIDGETQSHLLSEVIRRPAEEIFTLQDTLAQEVSELLREHLGRQVQLESWQAGTDHPEAWRLLQRANRFREDAEKRMQEGEKKTAVTLLSHADSLLGEVESLDPGWSAPYVLRARLAETRLPPPYGQVQWGGQQRQILERGIRRAEQALDRDSSNAEARRIRGRFYFWLSRQVEDRERARDLMARAEKDLQMAVREDPGSARAWYALSEFMQVGRANFEQARYYAERAQTADAYLRLPADTHHQLFYTAINAGNFESASRWCQEGQKRYPDKVQFRNCELMLLATDGAVEPDVARAWALSEEIEARASPKNRERFKALTLPKVAAVLARAGRPDSGRSVLDQARREGLTAEAFPGVAYQQAHTYLVFGEEDRALDLLSRFIEKAPQYAEMVADDIWFEELHDRPEFQKLVSDTLTSG